jgi:hypothetical protein
VGREQELGQLQATFDAVQSGQGALVTVVGEPGIGKTALCEQLATYVAVRGGRTLAGHCYEEGSLSLPYLAFVEALRSYVLARPPEAVKQELGSGAGDVARIVSEVREGLQVEPRPPGGDPDEDRWRLLQAATSFLRNAASVQPLVLVLEDLHWADRGTLDLLIHLARNLTGSRLLVVGTYRDVEVDRAHPLSAALAELRRVGSYGRVLLRGLTVEEVQRMIGGITGQAARWAFAEAVQRQTEGNPLFVQEVLRYLVEEGHITREGGTWRRAGETPPEMHIPEGLRDVIGKRLSQLSAACNRVLAVAAVIGREFSLDTLRRVADLPEEELVEALEEARHVAVLEEQARVGVVRYRFAHAFFRQTLYEEMSAPRRLRLHQDVARALESQYATRLEEHAAELAEHYAQSTDAADLRNAVHYGELAAQRAVAVYAYGEAVRLLEQALEVQQVLDPSDTTKRCDLLLALSAALMPAGEPQRVYESVAQEALGLAEPLRDRARAERACLLALEALYRYGSVSAFGDPSYRPWVERLDTYASPRSTARVYADAAFAEVHLLERRFVESHAFIERAVQLARELGDRETLYWAAVTMLSPQMPFRLRQLQIELARELAAQPRDDISAATLAGVLRLSQVLFLAEGDRNAAEQIWDEMRSLASRAHDPAFVLLPMVADAFRATLDGNLEETVERARLLIERGEELGSPAAARQWALNVTDPVLMWLGKPRDLAATGGGPRGRINAFELASLARAGRVEEAEGQLSQYLAQVADPAMAGELNGAMLAYVIEAAVLLGKPDAVRLTIDHVEPVIACPQSPWAVTSLARWVGAGARLLGDRERARAALLRGIAWAESINYRPEVALARLELAELLLEGTAEERFEAAAHLDFAIDEFRAMKMPPSLERALRHKGLLHA